MRPLRPLRVPRVRVPRVSIPRVSPAVALLPLRLFLGVTFVYAGIHKLSDRGFLTDGAPSYIGTQLEAFADGTPGGALLRTFALPFPEVAGIGVALVEITIGFLAVVGLLTRLAAAAGVGLSLVLFLTATWATRPYFLGSDIVFVFAWLPFVLAGAQGQPALDNLEPRRLLLRRRGRLRVPAVETGPLVTRRAMLKQALGLAGLTVLSVAGSALAVSRRSEVALPPPAPASPSPTPAPGGEEVAVAASADVPAGEALTYLDPVDGAADVVIRRPEGNLVAFSALCTHASCEVAYRGDKLRCPCHGAVFNAETGAVEAGPAPVPLPPRQVVERDGQIFAIP